MDAEGNLKRLLAKRVKGRITREAAELFVDDFEVVEKRIEEYDAKLSDDEIEEKGLKQWFPRTVEEIRVLLS
jgi:hypothetical protein